MSTFRELTYLVLDEVKGYSDDFSFTEDHIMFLLDDYRSFLLKQRYSDIKKQIPLSNFQTIEFIVESSYSIPGGKPDNNLYYKSRIKIPSLLTIVLPRLYTNNLYYSEIQYVSWNRLRNIGHNKYLENIIYCAVAPDGYMYFKSGNGIKEFSDKVILTGIFLSAIDASEYLLLDRGDTLPELIDREFPIEKSLVSPLVELTVKELLGAQYNPVDVENNAKDDLEGLSLARGRSRRSRRDNE